MTLLEVILISSVGILFGFIAIGVVGNKKKLSASFDLAQNDSNKILEDARREADRLVKAAINEAKEESKRRRKNFEEESKRRKQDIQKLEKKIRQREETLETKISSIDRKEKTIEQREQSLLQEERRKVKLMAEYEVALEQKQKILEKIASMSAEEAKKELMKSVEEAAKAAAKDRVKQIESETKRDASYKATEIVSLAVQRIASEYVNDSTITVVSLPNEEMKGRIIGREGRNIRAIEQATGIDLIIDDTPEAVIISSFNPMRREVAKLTLEKLIADGRIHPARIEETAKRVLEEFDLQLKEIGEEAAYEVGITDLPHEVIILLGKLKFKTSGVQSVLQHSVETALLAGIMAAELGMNQQKAKRAGLLHDIGKAMDQDIEGHHADIGADLCKKYSEAADLVEAVRNHHVDEVQVSPLSSILYAANQISAHRPAARKENLSTYIKRLDEMEAIVKSFPAIKSAHVLQAGREIRAFVETEGSSDQDVENLADQIVYKLREQITYPGQVRISIIRESKFTDYAT